MRHSLHSHIIYLENTILDVRNRLTRPDLSIDEIQDLELQLTLAQSALKHYREAYALELSVSDTEPPPQPGSKSGGETGSAENSMPKKKKEGLAGTEVRAKWLAHRRTPLKLRLAHSSGAASRAAI